MVELTPVQEKTLPLALQGKDLVVSAETGSGKTVAFLLPLLQRLLTSEDRRGGTRALVLVPTRELAKQILDELLATASYTRIKADMIIGGESFPAQRKILQRNPEVLIATPGRLLAHLNAGDNFLEDLEVLVLDEADRMLDMGFSDEVLQIVYLSSPERQTMLFSATLTQKGLRHVIAEVLNEQETIRLNRVQDKHENIQQQIILVDDDAHKLKILDALLSQETYRKALVFANKKIHADHIAGIIQAKGHRTAVLHGDLDQKERARVMKLLRDGKINVLVATDVAARGLDVEGVDLVVNVDIPRKGHDYIHRIGRTGRAGEKGLAVSLVSSVEWNLMASIQRYLKQRFEARAIAGLEGSYRGPKKLKSSGKAFGSKKKKSKARLKTGAKPKAKSPKSKASTRKKVRLKTGARPRGDKLGTDKTGSSG